MLRKLLKYDMRAIFRYWWIAAAVTVIMSIVGGFCGRYSYQWDDLPLAVNMMLSLARGMAIFCSAALLVLTLVLIFVRFYKNFFSDEGYLTFTLPVTRRQLLLSKVLSGTLGMCAAGAVCIVNVLVMNFIAYFDLRETLTTPAPDAVQPAEALYYFLYLIEAGVALVLFALCAVLFLYTCITFASMIVKKGKLIAAIGIYYGATNIVYVILQMFLLFGIASIGMWLSRLSHLEQMGIIALLLLELILFISILCAVLYILQQRMLERKLNLS